MTASRFQLPHPADQAIADQAIADRGRRTTRTITLPVRPAIDDAGPHLPASSRGPARRNDR